MSDSKLKVIVIGSGIAGLAAASVLREHHVVTVYERGDRQFATGGQGMCVFPNGVNILLSRGFDPYHAGGVPCKGYRSFNKSGELVEDFPIDFRGRYGADMLMMKRSDLRDELMRTATASASELGVNGDPARVVFNTSVVDLDPDASLITLSDGSIVEGDVVIVADGIHSGLRPKITLDEQQRPKKTGLTLFRISVSAEDVRKALGQLPEWWNPEGDDSRLNILQADDGTHRILAHYPLKHHEYRNFSCLLPMPKDREDVVESWYADGDKKEMLQNFEDFNQQIHSVLSVATEVKFHDLEDMEPLFRWNKGRALLVGDAAHTMTPLQGQGANMAIEDADSLRLLLPGMTHEEIAFTLQRIDSVRRPRATQVLMDTRQQAKDVTVEDRMAKMDYNCGYRGIHEALKGLQ
ncbi:FAD binding domain protein [Periconia macrospinosa]|uniref:FAD binding domain protein n=1 Tax=Periconia macrospinosa TaxID=97972 RepID=A0A2V1D2F0_9PLEO|nr:FAD binding domain protein [Periconia macrospinosa]